MGAKWMLNLHSMVQKLHYRVGLMKRAVGLIQAFAAGGVADPAGLPARPARGEGSIKSMGIGCRPTSIPRRLSRKVRMRVGPVEPLEVASVRPRRDRTGPASALRIPRATPIPAGSSTPPPTDTDHGSPTAVCGRAAVTSPWAKGRFHPLAGRPRL